MSDEGLAIVSFATGLIAGMLGGRGSPLSCTVHNPEVDKDEVLIALPITIRSGIQLEIIVREVQP